MHPGDSPTSLADSLHPATRALLSAFAGRRRWMLLARGAAVAILVLLACGAAIALADWTFLIGDSQRWGLSVLAYFAAVWAGIRMGWWSAARPNDARLAREIESADENFGDDLLSAVELADPVSQSSGSGGGSPAFRQSLQYRIARQASNADVSGMLPWKRIQRWLLASVATLLVAAILLAVPSIQWGRRMARALLPGVPIERASVTRITILEPSPPSRSVAQGDAVAVLAEVTNAGDGDVLLQYQDAAGDSGRVLMSRRDGETVDVSDFAGTLERSGAADASGASSRIDAAFGTRGRFAGNLTIHETPVRYRIFAGDAVTLWHELTPKARPQVIEIQKRYQFPEYTKLPDQIVVAKRETIADPAGEGSPDFQVQSEWEDSAGETFQTRPPDGDLEAVEGTLVELTVTFDQAVREATIRHGIQLAADALQPLESNPSAFTTSLRMRTPSTYQLDAVSIETELNQPFAPQYSVTPLPDAPPQARWQSGDTAASLGPEGRILGPLEVLDLAAMAADDLPMDRLVQEIQVNNDPVIQRVIESEADQQQFVATWKWDLMDLAGDSRPQRKLEAGDVIRTRIIAIDRLGQRGESEYAEILIADEGFDADRHRSLLEQIEFVRKLRERLSEAETRLQEIEQGLSAADELEIESLQKLDAFADDFQADRVLVRELMAKVDNQFDAGTWDQFGTWLLTLQHDWKQLRRDLGRLGEITDAEQRKSQQRGLYGDARNLRSTCSRLKSFTATLINTDLAVARIDDALRLQKSLAPLVVADQAVPLQRYPRYLNLATARLMQIAEFGEEVTGWADSSTRSKWRSFRQWAERWTSRLVNELQKGDSKLDQVRRSVLQFENELRNQIVNGIWDDSLASRRFSTVRDRWNGVRSLSDRLRAAADQGSKSIRAGERAKRLDDSEKISMYRLDAAQRGENFKLEINRFLDRVSDEQTRGRGLPRVDLRGMADLHLIQQAVRNVTRDGYADFGETPPQTVFQELVGAIGILDRNAQLRRAESVLDEMTRLESTLEYGGNAKLKQPLRLESYVNAIRDTIQKLGRTGIDWKRLQTINETHYDENQQRSQTVIVSRRWAPGPARGKAMVSAEGACGEMLAKLRLGFAELEPDLATARETILKYVETIPELARRAAEAADRAEQMVKPDAGRSEPANETDSENDATPDSDAAPGSDSSDGDAAPKEQPMALAALKAERLAGETMQSLIDLANNTNLRQADAEAKIRDADAASALIGEARNQARQSRLSAEAASGDADRDPAEGREKQAVALEDLEQTLEKVAAHFEAAQTGQDVAQSRQQLREAAETLATERALERQRREMEALASDLNRDPEEMLRQLEQELKEDSVMQAELSDIAKKAIQAAAQQMQQAADQEAAIRRDLERADPKVEELRRRIR
ncbi:MAG: hypothetical protein AAF958_00865, partial [Planctomycetota bacterium]